MPLEKALNRAWEVAEQRSWLQSRMLALEMAVVAACLILIATGLVGVGLLFRQRLTVLLGPSLHPLVMFLYRLLTAISSFTMALVTFVILFERLPNRPMGLRQAFPGALLTALLWEAARWLWTIFLPFFNYRHVYGSIGVMVSFMIWAYISSAVMLFGARVSQMLYRTLDVNETAVAADPSSTSRSPET